MAGSFADFLVLQAAKSLRLADVFHLQTANIQMRQACVEKTLWSDLLSVEFPGLDMSPILSQPGCPRSLVPLLRELHQPISGEHVLLSSVTEVQKLTRLLIAANRSAHTLLSNGGYSGHVLVGRMCFPSEGMAMALTTSQSQPSRHTRVAMTLPFCIGDSIPLQRAGLVLHIAWQGSRLYLAVSSDSDISGSRTVSVDIAVCSPAFTLNHRNLDVSVNSGWRTWCTGLFATTKGKAAAVEAFSNGVPCIVCVRRGQSTPTCHGISHSLNLESVAMTAHHP